MKTDDLNNKTTKNIFAVYGGRFQPATTGHKSVYDKLVFEFGSEHTWIATSNSTDRANFGEKFKSGPRKGELKNVTSPFDFNDKLFIWKGIWDIDNVIECKNPTFEPSEIMSKYPDDWAMVMAVGSEDVGRYTTNDDWEKWEGIATEGGKYYYEIQMINRSEFSGTKYRKLLASGDSDTDKKLLFEKLYGEFNASVCNLIQKRLNGEYG